MDTDPGKTPEWRKSLEQLALPRTFTVKTARGGWHAYYGYHGTSKLTIGTDLLPGIDWRPMVVML